MLIKKFTTKISHLGFLALFLYLLSWIYTKIFLNSSAHILFPFSVRNKSSVIFNGRFFAKSNFYAEPFNDAQICFGSNIVCNRNFYITSACSIQIGDNCLFGPNIFISDHDHGKYSSDLSLKDFEFSPIYRKLSSSPIVIGNSVWVGANVCILKGVKIGDNCVIGANSVVTKSLPPNSICVGSPCKAIRSVNV